MCASGCHFPGNHHLFCLLQPRINSYPEENLPDDEKSETIKHFPDSQNRAPPAHRRQSIPVCGPQTDSSPIGMTSSISSPGLLTARYSDLGKCIAFPKGDLFPVKGNQFGISFVFSRQLF